MSGQLITHPVDAQHVLRVELSNPRKHNAISVAMWRELRTLFEALQQQPREPAPRVVLLTGAGGHFAAGGDIEEFPQFRFEPETLRHFHEEIVAPALQAMWRCEIPIVARIHGSCIGGGLEIAACCDLRIADRSARFGAPIAKMGFPMAPGEVELLLKVVPAATLREILIEARLLDAEAALARGLVHRVVDDAALADEAEAAAQRIAALSPLAARLNKRTLRQYAEGGPTAAQRRDHFAYAADPEHREGVTAFLDKRAPRF
ncbi:MAG: enoyl-CoA hydratase/isomerase family protein [Pseudomonadota bacterium]